MILKGQNEKKKKEKAPDILKGGGGIAERER